MNLYKFEQVADNKVAPSWVYFISIDNVYSVDECKEIKKILLTKETDLLQKTNQNLDQDIQSGIIRDGGTGLGNSSITSRFIYFNLLNWNYDFCNKLKKKLKQNIKFYLQQYDLSYDEYYVKCWFNVLRKDQKILKHHHSDHPYTLIGGHLTICTQNTHTYYENPFNNEVVKIENTVGDLTLFPNWIKHWTDPYKGDDVRISIAMDVTYKKALDNMPHYPGKEKIEYCIL